MQVLTRRRLGLGAFLLAAMSVSAACGFGQPQSSVVSTVAVKPTEAPATSAPKADTAKAAGEATKPAAQTAKPTAAEAAKPAAAPAGGVSLTFVKDSAEVRYRAREVLLGQPAPSDAVGVTKEVDGTLVLGPNGKLVAGLSKITVDLRNLKSDQSARDNYLQRTTLQTATFPTATFTPTDLEGLPWPLPTSGTASVKLKGDLTVRGATKSVVWDVKLTFAAEEITVASSTAVTFADFAIPVPKVQRVASIEETVKLEIDAKVKRATS